MTNATIGSDPRVHPRGRRATKVGVVVGLSGRKTIKIRCDFTTYHSKYGKYLRRSSILHAHDENNEAKAGDTVEVMSCRRLSKTKCWLLSRIVSPGHESVA